MKSQQIGWIVALWRWIRRFVIGVGCFLAFAALIECIQAYQVLYAVHPYLGFGFFVIVLGAIAWGALYFVFDLMRRPVALIPPPACNLDEASARELRAQMRYLISVMERLSGNPLIPGEARASLMAEAARMKKGLNAPMKANERVAVLKASVDNVIVPAIKPLDDEAERRVRSCVRDTMLGVTVSPWRSMDLLVVLYRNGQMILEVSQLYNGRPRLRDQLRILSDVLSIVATVQFLNIGSKLIDNMTSWIPVLGRFADDIAQGVGAGLFTSVTGYAAIDRCRSFQGWDAAIAKAGMGNQLKQFLADLKGVVGDTIMPALRSRIEAAVPEDGKANVMDRVRAGIGEAIDKTAETLDSCVRKPAGVGYRGVTSSGAALWGGARKVGGGTVRAVGWTGGQSWKLVKGSGRILKRTVSHFRPRKSKPEPESESHSESL
jgi:uncharacterized membrane protein YcjF (UPF0283 family)